MFSLMMIDHSLSETATVSSVVSTVGWNKHPTKCWRLFIRLPNSCTANFSTCYTQTMRWFLNHPYLMISSLLFQTEVLHPQRWRLAPVGQEIVTYVKQQHKGLHLRACEVTASAKCRTRSPGCSARSTDMCSVQPKTELLTPKATYRVAPQLQREFYEGNFHHIY